MVSYKHGHLVQSKQLSIMLWDVKRRGGKVFQILDVHSFYGIFMGFCLFVSTDFVGLLGFIEAISDVFRIA